MNAFSAALFRPEAFRQHILDVIAQSEPDELADRLTEAHNQVVRVWDNKCSQLTHESTQIHADIRHHHSVLQQVQQVLTREMQQTAQLVATVQHQSDLLHKLHRFAAASIQGQVSAGDLMHLLTEEIPLPMVQPVMIAFTADNRFRAGTFRSVDGQITMVYTYMGVCHVAHGPTRGIKVEPAFLVGDRGVMPQSVIELEKGLRMEAPLQPLLTAI